MSPFSVGSATLLFLTVEAQNETGNVTTADNASGTTGAENATGEGSISGLSKGLSSPTAVDDSATTDEDTPVE